MAASKQQNCRKVPGVPLMTYNLKDFQIIAEEVDLREP